MGCSKSHDKVKKRGLLHKIGFYSLRSFIFLVSLLMAPLIMLLILVISFETIVLGSCPKNSIILNPLKRKERGEVISDKEINDLTLVNYFENGG